MLEFLRDLLALKVSTKESNAPLPAETPSTPASDLRTWPPRDQAPRHAPPTRARSQYEEGVALAALPPMPPRPWSLLPARVRGGGVCTCPEPRPPPPPTRQAPEPELSKSYRFPKASEFRDSPRAPRSLRQSGQPGVWPAGGGALGCGPAARPPSPPPLTALPSPRQTRGKAGRARLHFPLLHSQIHVSPGSESGGRRAGGARRGAWCVTLVHPLCPSRLPPV